MQVPEAWYVPVAVLSGVAFALLPISYRIGKPKRISPIHIVMVCALIGAGFFAVKLAAASWADVPAWVILAGAGVGVSQYFIILLVRSALHKGPVSAIACVLSISFVPVTVYSHFVFGEQIRMLQYLAFPLAAGSIVAASFGADKAGTGLDQSRASSGYGLILLAMLVINTIPFVMIKELGTRQWAGRSHMVMFGDAYFLLFYAALAVCTGLHLAIRRQFHSAKWAVLGLGALAGLGSLVGIVGLASCSAGPTATVFTLNNVSTVVATAVIAALFFGEGRSLAWYVTVICGVLAVVVSKLDAILL